MVHPLRKLNGWQRVGVIVSALWILIVLGVASKEYYDWVLPVSCHGDDSPHSFFTAWGDPQPCAEKHDPLHILTHWKVSFRFGRFLSILFLPVFVGWVVSYCLLWTVSWVKEGFRKNE